MTQSDTINDSKPSVIARILANPLVGLSPWILYSVVEGKGRLELSAALALGLAVVILSVGGAPEAVGIALIVVGIVLTRSFTSKHEATRR